MLAGWRVVLVNVEGTPAGRNEGVSQVVIAGVATSFGVESTARHAYDHEYNVVLATDAMTDLRAEAHENRVMRIFPLFGQTGTTAEIVALAAA